MKEPILVISDDVDLFSSVDGAEGCIEPPEVRTGITAFDANGQRLRAVVVRKFLAEVVRLEDDPGASADVPALRAGLIRFIAGREGVTDASLADLPLDELFVHARPHMTHTDQ